MSLEPIFDEMEISADPFALCELQGRCALGLGSQSGATLHYILAGEGELVLKDHPAIQVRPGTLALVPTMQPHTLRSFGASGHPLPECHPAELDLASHLTSGEQKDDTERLLAICSHVNVGIRGTGGLINLVREPIVEQVENDAMLLPIRRILDELSAPKLGSRAMIRALLLQCLIELLRGRLLAHDSRLNWMAALIDEKLWIALQQMLERPGEAHTVESLAALAGMSRSSFAGRFSSAYGSGPMELLRELRMHLAATMLSRSTLPVKRVAELVGFQSRSAFSRTFTSVTGTTPNQFRRQSQT
jgi:AraC-like DNA-binding protein